MDSIEYEEFKNSGAHVDKCPKVAGNAAKWAAEIILKEMNHIYNRDIITRKVEGIMRTRWVFA